jgi:hypothetical protein
VDDTRPTIVRGVRRKSKFVNVSTTRLLLRCTCKGDIGASRVRREMTLFRDGCVARRGEAWM